MDSCPICGQPFADGEPRYRRPDGDVHARCFKGPRVLVIDDDALFRDLVACAVRQNRYCQVDTVSEYPLANRMPQRIFHRAHVV